MKKIKLFEGFSGYGSQKLAFNRLGIPVESVGISEIDPDAIITYAALHCDESEYVDEGLDVETKRQILMDYNVGYDFKEGKSKIPRMKKVKLEQLFKAHILSKNKGDISLLQVDDLPDMNFFTYSFPCTDISVAGKQEGLEKGSGTRSSLLWECEKVITGKRPEYLMMENVKNLVGKNHKEDFDMWLGILDGLGYNNYWKVINAKDCGIPQNRERVFCISIRRDADEGTFRFNEPFDNGVRLKDLLEGEVEEKFYIADEKVEKLITQLKEKNQEISYCVDANYYKGTTPEQFLEKSRRQLVAVPCLTPDRVSKRQNGRRFKEDGEPMFTLTGQDRHGVLVIDDTQGFDGVRTYENESPCLRSERNGLKVLLNECKRLGGMFDGKAKHQAGSIWDTNGISPTLDTMQDGYRQPHIITHNLKMNVKVRKHEVDINGLKNVLRTHRNKTLKEIAKLTDKPLTLVEHWFRNDSSFSIPDADVWFKLKEILSIETDCFDKQIVEFEERAGVFEKAERVYDEIGISPTITCVSSNEKVLTGYRIRKLTPKECFRLMGLTDGEIHMIQSLGISNSQQYKLAGNSIVVDCMFFLKNLFNC